MSEYVQAELTRGALRRVSWIPAALAKAAVIVVKATGERWAIGRCYRAVRLDHAPRPSRRGDWPSLLGAALLLALAAPATAQDLPPEPLPAVGEEEPEAKQPVTAASGQGEKQVEPSPGLSAIGWCSLVSGDQPDDAQGCDAGVGASLYSWQIGESPYSVQAVASIGERTVGAGVGWCRGRICIGAGVTAVRDGAGVRTDTLAPALGATFEIGGRR